MQSRHGPVRSHAPPLAGRYRRWLQFSVKSLLLVILVASAYFAGIAAVAGDGLGKLVKTGTHSLVRDSFVALNQLGKSEDEKAELGQERTPDAIDMAPVQPHSAQRKARTCESCHNNPKAMGYGISGGVFQTRYPVDIVEDLIDQKTGPVIPGRYQIQIPKIADLDYDWSTIIKDGQQVQTVGTHWPLSRSLPIVVTEVARCGTCSAKARSSGSISRSVSRTRAAGSRIALATRLAPCRAMVRCSASPAGTPGELGTPRVSAPDPALMSSESEWPW